MLHPLIVSFIVVAAGAYALLLTEGRKILAPLLLCLGLSVFVLTFYLQGQPRPVTVFAAEEYEVVGWKIVEGENIYLYVARPGAAPLSLSLPWTEQRARQLQRLGKPDAKKGDGLLMFTPGQKNKYGTDDMFQRRPPPPLPPKTNWRN